eukprot:scaffold5615_cov103-Isochrysis_galbana.AAC.4
MESGASSACVDTSPPRVESSYLHPPDRATRGRAGTLGAARAGSLSAHRPRRIELPATWPRHYRVLRYRCCVGHTESMDGDALNIRDLEVRVERGGELKGLGPRPERRREHGARLLVIAQFEDNTRERVGGGAQHPPLVRISHEAVLRVVSPTSELGPTDGNSAADRLAAAVLRCRADVQLLLAAALPRGEVRRIHVDEGRGAG